MKGWFDAFRSEGGPTLYAYSNRTPVTGDPSIIGLYVIFATLGIAFLIIFPGIRKERLTTFGSVALSLFVGTSILVSKYGSAWHVAETNVNTAYRAFSREHLSAKISVHIGLTHFNVTLRSIFPSSSMNIGNESMSMPQKRYSPLIEEEIDFNERFYWIEAGGIQDELKKALQKGLPYPILTVIEYFSLDDEGFCWGRKYRQAGYYAGILLWTCFGSWLLMNLLVVVVPRYGGYQMILTGLLLLFTNLLYILQIPQNPPIIHFEDKMLIFHLGTSFWLILGAGGICLVAGCLIAIIDLVFPHKFSTVLEVDFDTPYDRHIIIEDSNDTKKKKGKKGSLEEPDGIGKRILRTLSKRGKGDDEDMKLEGHPNQAFQMDPPIPNSPWTYRNFQPSRNHQQHQQHIELRGALATAFAKNPALLRLASPNTPSAKNSPKSVSFRRQSKLETTYTVDDRRKDSSSSSEAQIIDDPSYSTYQNINPYRGIQRADSTESHGSSVSSFGLGLLSRQSSQATIHQIEHKKRNNSGTNSRHIPLQRIINQYPRTIELPRAAIIDSSRKLSTDSGTDRRDSETSMTSSNSSRRDQRNW